MRKEQIRLEKGIKIAISKIAESMDIPLSTLVEMLIVNSVPEYIPCHHQDRFNNMKNCPQCFLAVEKRKRDIENGI